MPRPHGKKVISTLWVFNEMFNTESQKHIYKAQLEARGFEKIGEIEELRAPVAKISTFRIFLSICSTYGLKMIQATVKNAYLNGTLEDIVYIEVPEFVKTKSNEVCRLNKAIYGLKESAAIWKREIDMSYEKGKFEKIK